MRTLSPSLLAAQQSPSVTPYVEVKLSNKSSGVVRLDWERLYTGTEEDYYHAATMPGDGSLIRVRITPQADGRKLYRQRVDNPGPGSDFSSWAYCTQYNVVVVAAASLGAEVSIFWINAGREIRRIVSGDCGVNWGSPELIDYSPTTAINGITAAYKPDGTLALFFADQSTIYIKKRTGGSWQPKTGWDKTTGDLSGVAAVYSGDWDLLLTGKDTAGNYKLWSLIYGNGSGVPAGTWSDIKEFASAPSDGNFIYAHAAMARPDVYRCFYVEKFTGTEAFSRPYFSTSVLDAGFSANLWCEPCPFDLSSEYGMAVAWHGGYCWLSRPDGVWRASLTGQTFDLTADLVSSRLDINSESGAIAVELADEDGRYSPAGMAANGIAPGCQLDFCPGCVTASGNEVSPGLTFHLEEIVYPCAAGKTGVLLHAFDGWQVVRNWRARHQFRWNGSSHDVCVRDILTFILARSGLKLEVISQSALASGSFPDFSVNPGDSGSAVIGRLLSFIPDVLFVEGSKAFLVYPQAGGVSIYSYSSDPLFAGYTAHPLLDGTLRDSALNYSRVRVEGQDGSGLPLLADTFDWYEIARNGERLLQVADRNISSAAEGHARGESVLRKVEILSGVGMILVPVNCGQQLWDVIDITDPRTGVTAAKKRVIGISLVYDTRKGEYRQRLSLGNV